MRRITLLSLLLLLVTGCARETSEIHTEEIRYTHNGEEFVGYIARDPAAETSRPGVLVVHEWWGHDEYARERARELARMGYVGFALDMYGDGEGADHPDRAGEMAGSVLGNDERRRARFQAALDTLRGLEGVDGARIAAIGYCFGGNVVLTMALEGADLAGVASFHGMLPAEAEPADDLTAAMMVFNGADDPMVPAEQLESFANQLEGANADFEIVNYEGVTHSFTNPRADKLAERFELPLAYDAEADRDSWQRLEQFLARVFSE